jgi:hypothetical protein
MLRRQLRLVSTSFVIVMLLVQLMMTAGHMHYLAVLNGEHGATVQRAEDADDHPAPFDSDETPCALCWAATVEGRALIPPLPALPLPPAGHGKTLSATITMPALHTVPRAFNSRAPPLLLG